VRMVTKASSIMLSGEIHNQIPMDGNHSTIVKFTDPSDPRYKIVVQRLKSMVERTARVVKGKFDGFCSGCLIVST